MKKKNERGRDEGREEEGRERERENRKKTIMRDIFLLTILN